jgi:hypothetical protein
MPQGCHELLRALLWDEWLIDLAPGEHDCTTIHPDDLDDFELDGASEHPAYRADGSPWPAPRAGSGEVLVGWVDIDRVDGIEVSSQAGASEFATVDELAVWLGMTFGPIEVPEAFQDWEVPDFAARGLIVIAQEPDPAIVTSEAWRMLIQVRPRARSAGPGAGYVPHRGRSPASPGTGGCRALLRGDPAGGPAIRPLRRLCHADACPVGACSRRGRGLGQSRR